MLPGDSRAAIDRTLFDDPRAVVFWDPRRLSGTWFGEHPVLGLGRGSVVWDAFYAFGRSAEWRAGPTDAITAGSTIIAYVGSLSRSFLPLLSR